MNKQILITIIVIGFAMLGLGFIFGSATDDKNEVDTFKDGWEAATERLVENGLISTEKENIEIREIMGNVKAINGNKINVEVKAMSPLGDPSLKNRVVEIGNDTQIYKKLNDKDSEQYQKELAEYNKQVEVLEQAGEEISEAILAPQRYYKELVTRDSLQVGQEIIVEAEEDIKNAQQFMAKQIIIYSSAI